MAGSRVVVVGGGVIGVCSAHYLAHRGADVVLLERDEIAAGASFGNAGTVSAGHPPLNKPGRVRRALLQMADPTSPLYIEPRWDPGLWRWLAEFAGYCTWDHVEACMEIMAPLGMEALDLFDELVEDQAIPCAYRTDGYLAVCRTDEGLEDTRHEAAIIERYGYRPSLLTGEELRAFEPAFADDVVGGVYYPEARTLDPGRFVLELAERVRRMGVDVRTGVEAQDLVLEGGRASGVRTRGGDVIGADAVVLATGPFSLSIARRAGVRLPVQPGKGYHRDLPVGEGAAPPLRLASVLHETSVFCTPLGEDVVRFAGTMEFSGLNDVMRPERLEQLTTAARRYLPGLGRASSVSEWCGLRPMASDGLPIVGPLPGVEGVAVATGHGMLGLTLAPVTGVLVADQILDGRPSLDYAKGLFPARFTRRW